MSVACMSVLLLLVICYGWKAELPSCIYFEWLKLPCTLFVVSRPCAWARKCKVQSTLRMRIMFSCLASAWVVGIRAGAVEMNVRFIELLECVWCALLLYVFRKSNNPNLRNQKGLVPHDFTMGPFFLIMRVTCVRYSFFACFPLYPLRSVAKFTGTDPYCHERLHIHYCEHMYWVALSELLTVRIISVLLQMQRI